MLILTSFFSFSRAVEAIGHSSRMCSIVSEGVPQPRQIFAAFLLCLFLKFNVKFCVKQHRISHDSVSFERGCVGKLKGAQLGKMLRVCWAIVSFCQKEVNSLKMAFLRRSEKIADVCASKSGDSMCLLND